MPEATEKKQTDIAKEAVANVKSFTTIPNSTAEFCIYTYKAEFVTYDQLMRPGFFNPAYSFVNTGDTIRVFLYNEVKKLTNFLEFIVVSVDKKNKVVTVAQVSALNLEKKVLA